MGAAGDVSERLSAELPPQVADVELERAAAAVAEGDVADGELDRAARRGDAALVLAVDLERQRGGEDPRAGQAAADGQRGPRLLK